MLYCLRADVNGNLRLERDITIQDGDVITHFAADADGRLIEVSACISVSAKDFKTTVNPVAGGAKLDIRLGGDPAISAKLMEHLQCLESHLAFSTAGALRGIAWETPKQERIPESDEEKPSIPIRSIEISFRDQHPTVPVSDDVLATIVAASNLSDSDSAELVVLKAFWREAMSEFTERRYIQAFYNFYFIIEGLFARGRSAEREVLKEFAKSAELTGITTNAISACFTDPYHRPHLKRFFAEHKCAVNVQDAQRFLVKMRGLLHHYSVKSTKRKAQPFSQGEFHSPAWFCMYFATQAIANRDTALPHAMPVS